MWMTRLALNRPVTIMVFVVAILVLGYYALGRMQVELQPKVDFPVITVVWRTPARRRKR